MALSRFCKFKSDKCAMVLCFACSFLVQLIFACSIKWPIAPPDELGTISSAAYISGYDWNLLVSSHGAFYGLGSTWFLFPLYKFINDGEIIYFIIRVWIAGLYSLSVFFSYKIIKRVLKTSSKVCFLGAIVCSFFTPMDATIVSNEALFILIIWILLYLIIALYDERDKKRRFWYSFWLNCSFVYSLLVHTRAIFLLVPLIASVILILFIEKRLIYDFRSIAIFPILLPAVLYINNIYEAKLFVSNNIVSGGSDAISQSTNWLMQMISSFGLAETVHSAFLVVTTNVMSLLLFTLFLICPVCIYAVKSIYFKKIDNMKLFLLIEFCVVGIVSMLILMGLKECFSGAELLNGRLFMGGRFFFYMRYYVQYLPPLLIAIIAFLESPDHCRTQLRTILKCILICLLVFSKSFVNVVVQNSIPFFDNNVFSKFIFTKYIDMNYCGYYFAIGIAVVFFVILFQMSAKNKTYLSLIALLVFYIFWHTTEIIEKREYYSNQDYMEESFDILKQNVEVMKLLNNVYVESKDVYKIVDIYQIYIPEVDFVPYLDERENEWVLISSGDFEKYENSIIYEVGENEIWQIHGENNINVFRNYVK